MFSKKKILQINPLPQSWNCVLMLVLIALTGFSSFFSFKNGIYIIAVMIFTFAMRKKQHIGKTSKIAIIIILFIFILQQIRFHGSIGLLITQTIRYLTLFYCAVLLRPNFKKTFITVMYYISIISLFLYGLSFIPFFKDILISIGNTLPELRDKDFLADTTNPSVSLYIYTAPFSGIRNCGPFWEPGMYVVFLILALGMNLFGTNNRFVSKKNIIFIVSLITTFSTTGYISLAFLVVSYVYFKNTSIGFKLISIIFLPIVLFQVAELDFMSEKVVSDIENADLSYSRFGAILYHIEKIQLNPFLGYGVNEWPYTNMDTVLPPDGSVSPNGWTIMAVVWGIPMAIVYFIFLYLGLKDITRTGTLQCTLFFISVLLSVFSQDVTNRLFFYVIVFIGIIHSIPYQTMSSKKTIVTSVSI